MGARLRPRLGRSRRPQPPTRLLRAQERFPQENQHSQVRVGLFATRMPTIRKFEKFANVISKIFVHFSIVSIKIGLYGQMFLELRLYLSL